MDNVTSDFNRTPQANRLHITFFGKRNVGKSSLINSLVGQEVALVADVAGTTTDPVSKAMEISPIGPCLITDTAGFDDVGEVGEKRVALTMKAVEHTDLALLVCNDKLDSDEMRWLKTFREQHIPTICVINKADLIKGCDELKAQIESELSIPVVATNAVSGEGIEQLRNVIAQTLNDQHVQPPLLGNLVSAGDVVLLVMPQDRQAPKGRLILPQVQTIRTLLDAHCIVMSCSTQEIGAAIDRMKEPPSLIITDSQVFDIVSKQCPSASRLTSFSVLMAAQKGDIQYFVESAKTIDKLQASSRVLIAEACSHVPLTEDIGREKIPRMLKSRVGEGLCIDIVSGKDFPDDLREYDLVIHCGACMFNRRQMMSRVRKAQAQHVPLTNYGITIAHLKGILNRVVFP